MPGADDLEAHGQSLVGEAARDARGGLLGEVERVGEGITVDAARAPLHGGMTRQALYVAMTRGRTANHAYIATDSIDPTCPDPVDDDQPPTGRQILEKVLATDGRELSATAAPPPAIHRRNRA